MRSYLKQSLYLPPTSAAFAVLTGGVLAIAGLVWGPEGYGVWSAVLALGLSWSSAVDIDRFILPDIVTLGLLTAGLVMHLPLGLEGFIPFVAGAIVGYGFLTLAALMYSRIRRRDGLGKGDAKLLAAAGAWLGLFSIPKVLLVACCLALAYVLAASLIRRRFDASQRLPFGPFLAVAFWFEWVFGDSASYADLFGRIAP